MKDSSRKISNVYWSFRRYLNTQLGSSYKLYWNPAGQPEPTDVDEWVIFESGAYDSQTFTMTTPRIFCVRRDDPDGDKMEDLVTAVMDKVDPQETRRYIDLYDLTASAVVSRIDLISAIVGPPIDYSTGIKSRVIDITARVKTKRRS